MIARSKIRPDLANTPMQAHQHRTYHHYQAQSDDGELYRVRHYHGTDAANDRDPRTGGADEENNGPKPRFFEAESTHNDKGGGIDNYGHPSYSHQNEHDGK